jgi:hypothetical protein
MTCRAGPGVSLARPRARATPHRGQPQEKKKKNLVYQKKIEEEEEERLLGATTRKKKMKKKKKRGFKGKWAISAEVH